MNIGRMLTNTAQRVPDRAAVSWGDHRATYADLDRRTNALARGLAEPTGNLFWPRRYYDKPQPMYGIPQSRRAKGQLEEALAEYEKIAAAHPDEIRPFVEMIDLAIHDLRDADRANAIFQNGLARLKNPDDKDRLAQAYAETRTRLDVRPPQPPIAVPPPHLGP